MSGAAFQLKDTNGNDIFPNYKYPDREAYAGDLNALTSDGHYYAVAENVTTEKNYPFASEFCMIDVMWRARLSDPASPQNTDTIVQRIETKSGVVYQRITDSITLNTSTTPPTVTPVWNSSWEIKFGKTVKVQSDSTNDCFFVSDNSANKICFGIDGTSGNRGIYDSQISKWMIYRNGTDETVCIPSRINIIGSGMAVGKVSEQDAFECALKAIFTGGIEAPEVQHIANSVGTWNQLIPNSLANTYYNDSFDSSTGVHTLTLKYSSITWARMGCGVPNGHKFLFKITSDPDLIDALKLYKEGSNGLLNEFSDGVGEGIEIMDNAFNWFSFQFQNYWSSHSSASLKCIVIDLTAMGLDSIMTVEQFEKLFSFDYYPYHRFTDVDDYIVERGTSGIWDYTKWNSGRITLEVRRVPMNPTEVITIGVFYFYYWSIIPPQNLLVDNPSNGHYSFRATNGYDVGGGIQLYRSAITMYGMSTTSITTSSSIITNLTIEGWWK